MRRTQSIVQSGRRRIDVSVKILADFFCREIAPAPKFNVLSGVDDPGGQERNVPAGSAPAGALFRQACATDPGYRLAKKPTSGHTAVRVKKTE
jgi:hypothetical protein